MLSLMTFRYYVLAIILSFIYQFPLFKIQKKHLLFIINMLVIAMIYFVSKKHYIFLMAHLTITFFLCRTLQKREEKKIFPLICLITAFLPLLFFKYSYPQHLIREHFLSAALFLKPATFIGISFYTFRISSVIIDILYGRIKEQISYFHFTNFSIFFPCILSGPLDRYSRFVSDVENETAITWQIRYKAIYRIAIGVFKKIVVADILWNFSNDSYNNLELYQLPSWKIIVGQYAYLCMLYFDFSGYCDVAIGLSQLFGINTPENFNHPWKARNIQIFWNSWHISFMHWLRDYIFFPLQTLLLRIGITNISINNSISYFSIFIIAGLWHGEQSHFLYYGIFHGIGFIIYFIYKQFIEKILSKEQRKSYMENHFIEFASIFITLHFFLISLFFFIDKQIFFSILIKRIFSP